MFGGFVHMNGDTFMKWYVDIVLGAFGDEMNDGALANYELLHSA